MPTFFEAGSQGAHDRAVKAASRRIELGRESGVDPATCNRHYTDEEREFLSAVDRYKTATGRKFPTNCEILGILKGLGYTRSEAS